jgi:hypothetical protein
MTPIVGERDVTGMHVVQAQVDQLSVEVGIFSRSRGRGANDASEASPRLDVHVLRQQRYPPPTPWMFLDPPSVMASPATPKRRDEVARARIQDRLAAKAVKKTRIEDVNCVRLFELGAQGSQNADG